MLGDMFEQLIPIGIAPDKKNCTSIYEKILKESLWEKNYRQSCCPLPIN